MISLIHTSKDKKTKTLHGKQPTEDNSQFFFPYSSQIREKESSTEYNKKYEKRELKPFSGDQTPNKSADN